jgi:hypothetical protein
MYYPLIIDHTHYLLTMICRDENLSFVLSAITTMGPDTIQLWI